MINTFWIVNESQIILEKRFNTETDATLPEMSKFIEKRDIFKFDENYFAKRRVGQFMLVITSNFDNLFFLRHVLEFVHQVLVECNLKIESKSVIKNHAEILYVLNLILPGGIFTTTSLSEVKSEFLRLKLAMK